MSFLNVAVSWSGKCEIIRCFFSHTEWLEWSIAEVDGVNYYLYVYQSQNQTNKLLWLSLNLHVLKSDAHFAVIFALFSYLHFALSLSWVFNRMYRIPSWFNTVGGFIYFLLCYFYYLLLILTTYQFNV